MKLCECRGAAWKDAGSAIKSVRRTQIAAKVGTSPASCSLPMKIPETTDGTCIRVLGAMVQDGESY